MQSQQGMPWATLGFSRETCACTHKNPYLWSQAQVFTGTVMSQLMLCTCIHPFSHFSTFHTKPSFPIVSLGQIFMYIACISLHVTSCHTPLSHKFSHNFMSHYGLIQPVAQPCVSKGHYSLSSPFCISSILSSTLFLCSLHHTPLSCKFCHDFALLLSPILLH